MASCLTQQAITPGEGINKAWQNTGTQGQQMTGVREQQAKLVKVSSGRQSSEGPKGTSTLLGPASSFSTIKEGTRCFYLEGSKGWPEFHCTGATSNAQGNSVHTFKAQGRALSHNPPSFTRSEFSTVYLQRPSMLPFWHFHT